MPMPTPILLSISAMHLHAIRRRWYYARRLVRVVILLLLLHQALLLLLPLHLQVLDLRINITEAIVPLTKIPLALIARMRRLMLLRPMRCHLLSQHQVLLLLQMRHMVSTHIPIQRRNIILPHHLFVLLVALRIEVLVPERLIAEPGHPQIQVFLEVDLRLRTRRLVAVPAMFGP